MSCSVNLVPSVPLQVRRRNRRRKLWLGVSTLVAFVIAGGWITRQATAQVLERLVARVAELDGQRSDLEHRLVAAAARRTQLLEQLGTAAAARHPQPWAGRFLALNREMPEGIFLTTIELALPDDGGARRPRNVPGAGRIASVGGAVSAGEPEAGSLDRRVRMHGFALDHGALIQALNTLQRLPGWQEVELVRATLEDLGQGQAVAFELSCVSPEVTP